MLFIGNDKVIATTGTATKLCVGDKYVTTMSELKSDDKVVNLTDYNYTINTVSSVALITGYKGSDVDIVILQK